MANYQGLALPAFGAGYHYAEATPTTENWYIEDDGVLNITHTALGADNAIALTITDGSTAFTSGYLQGYYVSLTTSSAASYTTGSSQINAIAVDMFLGGTIGCEAEGMYIYIAAGSSPSMASANISGITVYIDALGTEAAYVQDLFLHYANATAPIMLGSYILMKGEGTKAPGTALGFMGQFPTYFVRTIASQTGMVQSITCGGTQDKVLVCNLNGSTYWIPLYAASA